MIREFLHILSIEKILKSSFKTNNPASFRLHKDDLVYNKNLYQHTQLSALIELFHQMTPELYR